MIPKRFVISIIVASHRWLRDTLEPLLTTSTSYQCFNHFILHVKSSLFFFYYAQRFYLSLTTSLGIVYTVFVHNINISFCFALKKSRRLRGTAVAVFVRTVKIESRPPTVFDIHNYLQMNGTKLWHGFAYNNNIIKGMKIPFYCNNTTTGNHFYDCCFETSFYVMFNNI